MKQGKNCVELVMYFEKESIGSRQWISTAILESTTWNAVEIFVRRGTIGSHRFCPVVEDESCNMSASLGLSLELGEERMQSSRTCISYDNHSVQLHVCKYVQTTAGKGEGCIVVRPLELVQHLEQDICGESAELRKWGYGCRRQEVLVIILWCNEQAIGGQGRASQAI